MILGRDSPSVHSSGRIVHSESSADIGWSVATGFLVGMSPHTGSARLVPSIVGGCLVAVATFLVRRRLRNVRGARTETAPKLHLSLLGWGCLATSVFAFAPTVVWLVSEYTDSIWRNAHGLLLPLLIIWLSRRALQRADLPEEEPSAWGLPFVVVGCAFSLIDATARTAYLGVLGLVVATPGLSLLLLGARHTRAIAFPLSLVAFAFPIPVGALGLFSLSSATGWLGEIWLGFVGLHPPRLEHMFVFPGFVLGISQNCSGLAPLYGAVLASVVVGHVRGRWSLTVVLLLLCWPITVLVNSFRVVALALLIERYVGPGVIHTPVHGLSGIATFWVVVGMILGVGFGVGFRGRSRVVS